MRIKQNQYFLLLNLKVKIFKKLNIKYEHIQIKQQYKIKDKTVSEETMAVNNKLKFLHRKNNFLTSTLKRLLCNALIQPHFDYACSAWYPNLTKKIKHRIQTTQNKCIRFCQWLDNLKHISHE